MLLNHSKPRINFLSVRGKYLVKRDQLQNIQEHVDALFIRRGTTFIVVTAGVRVGVQGLRPAVADLFILGLCGTQRRQEHR